MVVAVQAYSLPTNPMKVVRNVSTYALWPTRWTRRGYVYLWGCGHEDVMPHNCPKGPNRATLFQAPDRRLVRPAWGLAERFMDRHKVTLEYSADEAREIARRFVGARRVA